MIIKNILPVAVLLLIVNCELPAVVSAQNNALVINRAYITLSGGSKATPLYLVVNQNNTLGITRNTAAGYIINAQQYNYVKWMAGTGTGNYVIPFGFKGVAEYYLPFILKTG